MSRAISRHPLALAVSLALAAGGAQAATLTVNSKLDDGTNCTLREAITAVNANNVGTSGCSASGSGVLDTIVFASSLSHQTIGLTSALPAIAKSVTITGPVTDDPSGLVIQGGNGYRVLAVTGGASMALSNVTLSGGKHDGPGGGLYVNSSTVTLNDTTISGNTISGFNGGGVSAYNSTVTLNNTTVSDNYAHVAGGVYVKDSTVTLNNTTVSGNRAPGGGGGLYVNSGSMTLNDTTLSGNSASGGAGGGVLAAATSTLELHKVTVSRNVADSYGGGIDATGGSIVTVADTTVTHNSAGPGGGGLTVSGSTVALTRSTVSGNSAHSGGGLFASSSSTVVLTDATVAYNSVQAGGGGMFVFYGNHVTLTNATVSGNSAGSRGGGVYAKTNNAITLTHSILANNVRIGHAGNDCESVNGGTVNGSYSLILASNYACGITDGSNHNIVGEDPKLGPLGDHGGPTETMLPASTSPAIDAGPVGPVSYVNPVTRQTVTLTTDQRGFPRQSGAKVDIGAVEYQHTLGIVPDPVDVGTVAVNGSPINRTVTVNAPDGGSAALGTVSLATPAGAFSLPRADNQCNRTTLDASNPACTLTVAFAPTTAGAQSTTLTVPDASGNTLASATVQGSATDKTVRVGGSGPAGASLTLQSATGNSDPNCGLVSAEFLAPGPTPPGGDTLAGQPVSFTVAGCTPGATVTLSLDLGASPPAGASAYKYGPTQADNTPHWYPLPGASINGPTLTFSVTDGAEGDSDLTANGTITDPVAELKALPPSPIPTLSVWGVALLSGLLGLIGGWPWFRRRC